MGFDGIYKFQEASKDEKINEAHKDALKLLQIVHDICQKLGIRYSLCSGSLICHLQGVSFNQTNPTISIMMKYEDMISLQEQIKQYALVDNRICYAGRFNTKQFDDYGFWIALRNNVELPAERKCDEIYYYTKLYVSPLYAVGSKIGDFRRISRMLIKGKEIINSREPIPQRTIRAKIHVRKKILHDWIFRRYRKDDLLDEVEKKVIEEFSVESKNRLLVFRTTGILIYDYEINEVEEIDFCGTKCLISVFAKDILSRYPDEYIKRSTKYRKSELNTKGGEILRRVQLIQTEMLVEFDRICSKNGIRYHIAFGTLLGAVRHGGFIPWDDDVDVILPIEDYEKLDQAMKKDLDTERFFWRTIDTDQDFNLTYKHLKRNNTIYTKPGREKYNFHRGVLIDVFPVFHAANNRFIHWVQTQICIYFRRAIWAYIGADNIENPVKRCIYNIMKKAGPKKNLERFMKIAKASKEKNQYYSYYNGMWRSPYHTYYLSDDAFNNTVRISFEGHKLCAPEKFNEALSYCFGKDYMLYPPIRKRVPPHFALVELGDLFLLNVLSNDSK